MCCVRLRFQVGVGGPAKAPLALPVRTGTAEFLGFAVAADPVRDGDALIKASCEGVRCRARRQTYLTLLTKAHNA